MTTAIFGRQRNHRKRWQCCGRFRQCRDIISWPEHEAVDLDAAQIDFPHDPLAQMYLAAALLQIPSIEKQALLAAAGAPELLTALLRLYRRENALLNRIKPPASEAAAQRAWLN